MDCTRFFFIGKGKVHSIRCVIELACRFMCGDGLPSFILLAALWAISRAIISLDNPSSCTVVTVTLNLEAIHIRLMVLMSSVCFQLAFLNPQLLVRAASQHMVHAHAILSSVPINVGFVWPSMYGNQIRYDLMLLKLFYILLSKAAGVVHSISKHCL